MDKLQNYYGLITLFTKRLVKLTIVIPEEITDAYLSSY